MTKAIKEMYRKAGVKAPDGKGVHTARFHRCVVQVSKDPSIESPHAVCMKSLGVAGAVKKGHRRYGKPSKSKGNPHGNPCPGKYRR